VDLQLSGHTHRGQVWPLNWVTKKMYECDYGQWRKGKTDYYVSSGMGIWGGKFRIGTDSEYAVITVTPNKQ
jgi:predicted MPP superfamily phosphohydrolase